MGNGWRVGGEERWGMGGELVGRRGGVMWVMGG